MGSGLFWNHSEGDKVRIHGEDVDIELFYKNIAGAQRKRSVTIEIKGAEIEEVCLDDNEPVRLASGVGIRIAGYRVACGSRIHYIVDKKYKIDFL